eukprot:gene18377-21917_t
MGAVATISVVVLHKLYRNRFSPYGILWICIAIGVLVGFYSIANPTTWARTYANSEAASMVIRQSLSDPTQSGFMQGCQFSVHSAGMEAGNFAHFYLGESKIPFSSSRGMNILSARNEICGEVLSTGSFDTCGAPDSAAADLVAFIDEIPAGAVVMIAVQDSGVCSPEGLKPQVVQALKLVGAAETTLLELTSRMAYALVGLKGLNAR